MYGLAKAAGVSYRTVFKAEMEARPRLSPNPPNDGLGDSP